MSEKNTNTEPEVPALVKKAPELLPLWDWWVKEGRSTVMMLVVAGLAVAAFYAGRNWLRGRDMAANAALVNAYTTEELENAVSSYGSTKVGPALRIRLAKSYFDAERYQDALDTYDVLIEKAKSNAAFADVAVVGRAYSLEGLKKYKEAEDAFAAYANDAANTNSYLLLTAKLGAARCKALAGDKAGALKDFDALKSATTDEMAKMRIERMTDAVKRHDPKRAALSLFDAANAAAAAVAEEKKTDATKKVEAPKKPEAPKVEPPKKPEAPKVAPPKKPEAPKVAPPKKPEPPKAPAPAKSTPAPAKK